MSDTREMASGTAPLDLATMREAVDRLLDPDAVPDALPPVREELVTLTLQIRGHLQLILSELEQSIGRLQPGSVCRYTLRQCLWEAHSRLEAQPSSRYGGEVGHARRLARVLRALCEHYEQMAQPPS
ncbi:DUF6415 family natural product biosynthesis protein [Streptomyces bungoensis]|uniref:DUF6415 family natural product biosynthesis protein n=1 Tax=Streptomyces bungoensis TaxID=285568 RepID=UPI003422EA62